MRGRLPSYSGGTSGILVFPDDYCFDDTTDRDSYFSSNPSELVEGVRVIVGTSELQMQEYRSESWVDITPVVRGPSGADGSFPVINTLTEKETPVSADLVIIEDSADEYAQKKVEIGNLPGGSGASAFTDLTDAISDYTGLGGQFIKVKTTEDGLESGTPSGSGDMTKAVYDTDNDGSVDAADSVPWSGVSDKPSAFTPDTHASGHVTGGGDAIADAIASGNSGLMSGTDKAKLDGIAEGAEVNVQSDWNATEGDALILNKPSIPSEYTLPTATDSVLGGVKIGSRLTITDGILSADVQEGTGDVIGPSTSTDNSIARFDGTDNKTVQGSLVTIDDDGSINIPDGQSYKKNGSALTHSDIGAAASDHNHSGTYQPADSELSLLAALSLTGNAGKKIAVNSGADAFELVDDSSSVDIHGTTEETSVSDCDEILLYDASVAVNRRMNRSNFLSGVGSGGGITWTEVTGTTGDAAADNGYICNNANLVTITLPSTIAVGKTIRIAGSGAGGWKLAQNASQVIYFGDMNTTTGTGGYLASVNRYDSIEIICITADTTFNVIGSMGDITVV